VEWVSGTGHWYKAGKGLVPIRWVFSVICLIFAEHARRHRVHPMATAWYAKKELTFSDAMATVRRQLWRDSVFGKPSEHDAFEKLPRGLRKKLLLNQLSRAA